MPTPPAPAWTRIRSPARRCATLLSACHAVMKTTGSVAASSNDRLPGMGRASPPRHMLHPGPHGRDDPANLVAEDARIRRLAGIKRQRLEDIAEVHACGF